MPDLERKTVSASQAAALLDASPYITRFMLYRWLKYGDRIDSPEHNRMDWGLKMEHLFMEEAAAQLHFEVQPTRQPDGTQPYVRSGPLGCSRDAKIICPDRGPGALETKACFDYGVWADDWRSGKAVPRHIEIQLQTQMFVGDGPGKSYNWGVVSVWHAADQKHFERKPIPALWDLLQAEAAQLFDDIAHDRQPDPFGTPAEAPLLAEAFPLVIGNPLDLSNPPDEAARGRALKIAEQVRQCAWHSRERLGHDKAEKKLKAELLAFAADHDEVKLPYGIRYNISEIHRGGYTVEPSTYRVPRFHVPDNIPDTIVEDIQKAGGLGG